MTDHTNNCETNNPAVDAGPCDCGADVAKRLAEIQARVDAATDNWKYEPDDEGSSMGWIMRNNEILFSVSGDSAQQDFNASFAAHARQDVPFLLSLIAEQTAEIERLNREIDGIYEDAAGASI